tara:strand:- start:298 stop:783 length:486 start_codon:yes stop_codon:yes gene_type:complete
MNLRDLTSDQEAILAQVESGNFTLDDVSDHLELLESERNQKIENYLHVINNLEVKLKAKTDEIKRIEALKDVDSSALANIKAWLLMSMQDGEKHEFDLFKVSRVKGREVVSFTNEKEVPEKYIDWVTSKKVDKRALLADLKTGVNIDGAEITTGNPSLRIK